jgi:hypothetical protein
MFNNIYITSDHLLGCVSLVAFDLACISGVEIGLFGFPEGLCVMIEPVLKAPLGLAREELTVRLFLASHPRLTLRCCKRDFFSCTSMDEDGDGASSVA